MKEVNASSFIEAWKVFIKIEREKILNNYFKPKNRTKAVIGNNKRTKTESPLGNALLSYFNENEKEECEYRTEEYSIDLVVAKKENFTHRDLKTNEELGKDKGFYPYLYEIIIESENYKKRTWEEMIKLTRYKAKLKVLITYADAIAGGKDPDKDVKNTISNNFKKAIEFANSDFLENKETKYILIIGQRENNGNARNIINWNIHIYNTKGENENSIKIK